MYLIVNKILQIVIADYGTNPSIRGYYEEISNHFFYGFFWLFSP